jgi:predicted RNase H-like HicB family nuclease
MQTKKIQASNRRKAREFVVVIERDEEGWYIASVPELRGCHTQARSLDELTKRIKEAIFLCLQVSDERETKTSLELVGLQRVAV